MDDLLLILRKIQELTIYIDNINTAIDILEIENCDMIKVGKDLKNIRESLIYIKNEINQIL